MSVRLTIWEYPTRNNPKDNSYKHAVYDPLISRMTSEPNYPVWDSFQRQDYLNHMLSVYNGRLLFWNSMRVQLEFETQEDLTQFILTWS